jgi:hypothetical protein
MKYMDGVVKDEYGKPINVGYPEAFKKVMVDENGSYLKMRKMPGEDDRTFAKLVIEAKESFKARNFTQCKELYIKALKIKPGDEKTTAELNKVEKILAELDKVYNDVNMIN